jgi:signal transduction histidine kinase
VRLPFASGFTAEAVRFQWRLLGALALVVLVPAAIVLLVARHNLTREEEHRRETEFQVSLALLRSVQSSRHAALVERCKSLATKSRIQAALEDNAEDLLYLSARDELRDLLAQAQEIATPAGESRRTARFYRFLDAKGRLLVPEKGAAAGELAPAEEDKLSLTALPDQPRIGYLALRPAGREVELFEMIVIPIFSTESGRKLAALVLGFEPLRLAGVPGGSALTNGIWLDGRAHMAAGGPGSSPEFERNLAAALAAGGSGEGRHYFNADQESWLVFSQRLDAGGVYAPAYEVCAFPLGPMLRRQRVLTWQIIGVGAGVMLLGLGLSYFLSYRLSVPVERLAHDSEVQRMRRAQAEAALETTSAELDRTARFSANASHQLKTPVAVMRAGLETLQARGTLGEADSHELETLIHQTYRISSVIEDLLLLSRMDAGRLKLDFTAISLSDLIAAALDDLSALAGDQDLKVEQDCPPDLPIAGEKRYTALIVQNLLENARKYNRPGGSIRITARKIAGGVSLTIGNTALRPIPAEVRAHIFERFHRGAQGENVPGYGLGLNLARELARLHGGDLQLVRSDEAWTEFAVSFRSAPRPEGVSA